MVEKNHQEHKPADSDGRAFSQIKARNAVSYVYSGSGGRADRTASRHGKEQDEHLEIETMEVSVTVFTTGMMHGTVIHQNFCTPVAPSISAASFKSSGTV